MRPINEQSHYRRCHECRHIDQYVGNTIPQCRCHECGSADTRRLNHEPPLWDGTKGGRRGLYVPDQVAKCPECGDGIVARCHAWQDGGRPVAESIELECISEWRDDTPYHEFTQDKWQPIRNAIYRWCGARVDYPKP